MITNAQQHGISLRREYTSHLIGNLFFEPGTGFLNIRYMVPLARSTKVLKYRTKGRRELVGRVRAHKLLSTKKTSYETKTLVTKTLKIRNKDARNTEKLIRNKDARNKEAHTKQRRSYQRRSHCSEHTNTRKHVLEQVRVCWSEVGGRCDLLMPQEILK
jgi:hypothetical protein